MHYQSITVKIHFVFFQKAGWQKLLHKVDICMEPIRSCKIDKRKARQMLQEEQYRPGQELRRHPLACGLPGYIEEGNTVSLLNCKTDHVRKVAIKSMLVRGELLAKYF